MKRWIRMILPCLLALCFVLQPVPALAEVSAAPFDDVPDTHWAAPYIQSLRQLGITNGMGNNRFGLGRTLTRAEFVTFLCNLMGWEKAMPETGYFTDNQNKALWYFSPIETALRHGAIDGTDKAFRPDAPITREEMAIMLVRTLGYNDLAGHMSYLTSPFADVTRNIPYIAMAADFGLINGKSPTRFDPYASALREEAAAILMRMYEGQTRKIAWKNSFYAISSYVQQSGASLSDSVCFGWARLEKDGNTLKINATTSGGNEYAVPAGSESVLAALSAQERLLMIAVADSLSAPVLADANLRAQAMSLYTEAMAGYDGVVVDFESLKSPSKQDFLLFLKDLQAELMSRNKLLYVAVHPARRPGVSYYDGYDFRAIGAMANKVILMAHDYNPKSLTDAEMAAGQTGMPPAPLDEVYWALRAITDKDTGVQDKNKIMLQLSFGTAQWKLSGGKVTNRTPFAPTYQAVASRIASGVTPQYNALLESPYLSFRSEEDGTDNIVWYEDTRSVTAKLKLARLFGVTGVSVWRLGLVPQDAKAPYFNVYDMLYGS